MAVSGGVAVGLIAASVAHQLNKMDMKKATIAKGMILNIRDKFYAGYLESYDDLMDYLLEFVRERVYERYEVNKSFARDERILKSLVDAKEARYQMRMVLKEYADYLV